MSDKMFTQLVLLSTHASGRFAVFIDISLRCMPCILYNVRVQCLQTAG